MSESDNDLPLEEDETEALPSETDNTPEANVLVPIPLVDIPDHQTVHHVIAHVGPLV